MTARPSSIHVNAKDKNKRMRNGDSVKKETKSSVKCWMEEVECTVKARTLGFCQRWSVINSSWRKEKKKKKAVRSGP